MTWGATYTITVAEGRWTICTSNTGTGTAAVTIVGADSGQPGGPNGLLRAVRSRGASFGTDRRTSAAKSGRIRQHWRRRLSTSRGDTLTMRHDAASALDEPAGGGGSGTDGHPASPTRPDATRRDQVSALGRGTRKSVTSPAPLHLPGRRADEGAPARPSAPAPAASRHRAWQGPDDRAERDAT